MLEAKLVRRMATILFIGVTSLAGGCSAEPKAEQRSANGKPIEDPSKARRWSSGRPSMTNIIKGLERTSLVVINRAANNGRPRRVSITLAGLAALTDSIPSISR